MEFTAIGYFTKTHGVKGHLILRDEADFETEGLTAFFCESATGKAPYFIEELNEAAQGLIVKLEEINSVEKAKSLINKTVFVDSRFAIQPEEDFPLLGFILFDAEKGRLGPVTGISDNGSHELISVDFGGKEIILPYIADFIQKVDEEKKEIHFKAPEGLIDIYLE